MTMIVEIAFLVVIAASLSEQGRLFCQARCAQPLPVRDQFEQSELAVRVQLQRVDHTSALVPFHVNVSECPVSIYAFANGDPAPVDHVFVFQILEEFKDSSSREMERSLRLTPGEEIVIVYGTDTGLQQSPPSRFTDDADGFLAFLESMDSSCGGLFIMSECDANSPWSALAEEDRAWLRNQTVLTNITTTAPSRAETLCWRMAVIATIVVSVFVVSWE